ncbi:hypothetical protein P3T29_004725 [Kitasatospora sp. MAP5-34]|nr:hypothetical protein [Kitasatospora sp. MAP5-34]
MQRVEQRGPHSQLTIWTGDDGPVGLGATSVGVEYRGLLGQPSSYGLLAASYLHPKGEPRATFNPLPSQPGAVIPPVEDDHLTLGHLQAEYQQAIAEVVAQTYTGLHITAAVSGEAGSSVMVFRRLALLLTRLNTSDLTRPSTEELWRVWDNA